MLRPPIPSTYYNAYSDAQLIRHAYDEINPMLDSDVVIELLKRLEENTSYWEDFNDFFSEEHGIDTVDYWRAESKKALGYLADITHRLRGLRGLIETRASKPERWNKEQLTDFAERVMDWYADLPEQLTA